MIHFIKQQGQFIPMYTSDHDKWDKIPEGKPHSAAITKVRDKSDIRLFKKYWALCRLICDNSNEFFDQEDVSDQLKLKCRLIKVIETKDNHTYFKPKSIAWENMPPEQFQMYWERFIKIACELLQCTEYEINENLIF